MFQVHDEYHPHYKDVTFKPSRKVKVKLRLWNENQCCVYCGVKLKFEESTLDHKIPRSKGGKNNIENLVIACHDCNQQKSDLHLQDFLNGRSFNS